MPGTPALRDFLSLSYDTELRPRDEALTAIGTVAVDAAEFSGVRFQAESMGYRVFELRGTRMRTLGALYDEFAAALQFPYFFRPNKDSFDECMWDLFDTADHPGSGYLLAIRDAGELLAAEPHEREWFAEAIDDYSTVWQRLNLLFRVVLQGGPEGLAAVPIHL
ncbi:barstar family protein [Nocardia sp. CA-290969]|uniref:barstar family protein n=1 Tax=Nocardia sp. CA-290969 TaxID=3239986 RepID=UPI003D8BCBFD